MRFSVWQTDTYAVSSRFAACCTHGFINDYACLAGLRTITGGAGADVLRGGGGVNTFVYNAVFDVSTDSGFEESDTITDLKVTDFILLNLSNMEGFNINNDVTLILNQIEIRTFSLNSDTIIFLDEFNPPDQNDIRVLTVLNVTPSNGGQTFVGGVNADTVIGGDGADNITGGAGADVLTDGGGADVFVYTAVAQGGNVATQGITALTAGDVIIDFVSGTDDLNYAATATGTNVVVAVGAAINLTTSGVILVNTSLDFTAVATDWAAVAAALNTAGNSLFTEDASDYFAVLDDNAVDPDQ